MTIALTRYHRTERFEYGAGSYQPKLGRGVRQQRQQQQRGSEVELLSLDQVQDELASGRLGVEAGIWAPVSNACWPDSTSQGYAMCTYLRLLGCI